MTSQFNGTLLSDRDYTVEDLENVAGVIGSTLKEYGRIDGMNLVDYVRRRYDLRVDVVQAALLYMLDRGLAFSDAQSRISDTPNQELPPIDF